ncbi:uncharacterized protein LOC110913951 [Helianthus annuus]|uniref:uncharacterized protein LOC110913951 n=1 Tax=Helianthus annuus TaxID=4232 RepID=UPI001652BB37|nr:uncharacterized protein LOC110913951 [Helianthus annuus]
MIQQHFWIKIGDGMQASMWFDKWDVICPLSSLITPRAIANAGFTLYTKVADVYRQGEWGWPDQWLARYLILHNIQHIDLHPRSDKVVWRSSGGKELDYSASSVWEDIRAAQNEVPWSSMVWFPQANVRHSFFMWLLVWNGVKDIAGLSSVANSWDIIYNHLVQFASSKKAVHVIGKLVVSAAGYFVWQERNSRLFTSKKRCVARLTEIILATVRMKLHTMRFKRTSQVERILQEWSLPRGLVVEDDDCG